MNWLGQGERTTSEEGGENWGYFSLLSSIILFFRSENLVCHLDSAIHDKFLLLLLPCYLTSIFWTMNPIKNYIFSIHTHSLMKNRTLFRFLDQVDNDLWRNYDFRINNIHFFFILIFLKLWFFKFHLVFIFYNFDLQDSILFTLGQQSTIQMVKHVNHQVGSL